MGRESRPLRVLVVSESFLSQVNGVTTSVCKVLEHLAARGHEAMLVAPTGPPTYAGASVHVVPSVPLPLYRGFEVGLASRRRLEGLLRSFAPDVVHLASPATLGARAAVAAERVGIPVVAVYQTDLVGFARRYGVPGSERILSAQIRRIHCRVERTLAPSRASLLQLTDLGVPRLAHWPRGVDLDLFDPARRSSRWRSRLGRDDDVIVGYVGRLAAEKQLHLLHSLHGLPGVRLVLVGTGPSEGRLRRLLPAAVFLGVRQGRELADIVASLDIFVHTGTAETYCQSAQEALASGVPVVAPAAGGLLDLIEPGRNGLLYRQQDGRELRRSVFELVVDPVRRRAMADIARRSVQDRSWTEVCDQLLWHYTELVRPTPSHEPAGR